VGDDARGRPVAAAFRGLLPMLRPSDLVASAWDVSCAGSSPVRPARPRADCVLARTKQAVLARLPPQLRDFRAANALGRVIVLWSANTERDSEVTPGAHGTPAKLLRAIADSHPEVSPSTLFAVAAIEEGFPYINGAPQNTSCPRWSLTLSKRGRSLWGMPSKRGRRSSRRSSPTF
jgi:myo-inositol-1-phosphate synthase